MSYPNSPSWIGQDRTNRSFMAPCGICGDTRKLSRTHVPPQATGNTGRRYREQISNGHRGPGTLKDGGLWVYGLCSDCNSLTGGAYDNAYVALASEVRTANRLVLPSSAGVPAVGVAPGLVARSVMFSMFGLWLRLRESAPALAAGLKSKERELALPPQYRLRVAAYRGRPVLESLVSVSTLMSMDRPYSVVSAFYFEPFAWALTHEDDQVLDDHGWGDATDWIRFSPDARRNDLRHVLDRLPVAVRPADIYGVNGIELSSEETLLLRGT